MNAVHTADRLKIQERKMIRDRPTGLENEGPNFEGGKITGPAKARPKSLHKWN